MSQTLQERNAMLTKKRWIVLVASCLINLCIGAMYAWSVFAAPMAEELSKVTGTALTAADLAIVFSIGNGDGFITLIAGGFITEKLGTRWVIFTGGVLFGLGFIVCGLANSVGVLILGFGLLCGLAMGLAYGQTISNSVKFFPDKAGLIGGIATASYGISSVIIPPIANALISQFGVRKSFISIGIVTVVVVGVCSMLIVKCPADFVPDGWVKPAPKMTGIKPVPDRNWKEMLRQPLFYVMLVMLFCGAVFGMMAISQASNIAQNMIGMTPAAAALVVSILALFNTFGRIAAGYLSDAFGCIRTLTGVYVLAIVAMALLYFSSPSTSFLFYIGICMVGVCFGAFMGVYPSFTAKKFGAKNSSVNYGIMFIGFSAAGILGPMIMGNIFRSTGSYQPAFLIALGLAVLGFVLSYVCRAVRRGM